MDHNVILYVYKSNELDRRGLLFDYKYRLRLFLCSYSYNESQGDAQFLKFI